MEEMLISSCLPSSSPSGDGRRESLQLLLQGEVPAGHWWNYAIFWQPSTTTNASTSLTLTWKDGHFQGLKHPGGADVMTDPEWFYMTSFTKTYTARDGILGKTFVTRSLVWLAGDKALRQYSCDRVHEAQAHGIQTLVCIPASDGVLELGSSDLNEESWRLVQNALSLFSLSASCASNSFNDDFIPHSDMSPPKYGDMSVLVIGADSDTMYGGNSFDVGSEFVNNKEHKRSRRNPVLARNDLPNNVEAERQRRDKMNTRFYALRSVVPNVTRMDKASLLSDAVSYIKDLRAQVRAFEARIDGEDSNHSRGNVDDQTFRSGRGNRNGNNTIDMAINHGSNVDVEVKFLGEEAIIRVQSEDTDFPAMRLMKAMRDLGLQVRHATISSINGLMLQDVIVRVSENLSQEDDIKSAILARV